MLVPSNTPFFSMITVRMAKKFPNSGTLDYHVVDPEARDETEKARIPIKSHILVGCMGPGHRIALSFMEMEVICLRTHSGKTLRLRRPLATAF
jgi:hypothetical protein